MCIRDRDQEIEFVISEFNPRRNRVIGDRRQLLVAERAEKQKELFARLQVGDRMEGTVKNVTDFGAFIDLGGEMCIRDRADTRKYVIGAFEMLFTKREDRDVYKRQ